MSKWGIILAGGVGGRLYPLSTEKTPKFLLDLSGTGQSLLCDTIDRVKGLFDGVIVVTNSKYAEQVLDDVGVRNVVVLSERRSLNTLPALVFALMWLHRAIPDVEYVGVFPADHYISNLDEFNNVVISGIAESHNAFTMVGFDVEEKSTQFGYIQAAVETDNYLPRPISSVHGFLEKPHSVDLIDDSYLCNSGMFFLKFKDFMDFVTCEFPNFCYDVADYRDGRADAPAVSIDTGLVEPFYEKFRVIRAGDMGWKDLGTFESLLSLGSDGLFCRGDNISSTLSTGVVISDGHRPVSLNNVDNIIVIDNKDGLYISRIDIEGEV